MYYLAEVITVGGLVVYIWNAFLMVCTVGVEKFLGEYL